MSEHNDNRGAPFVNTQAGRGKTFKDDLLSEAAALAMRSATLKERVRAAFDHPDPDIAAEQAVIFGMEEARWTRRKGGNAVPPVDLIDTETSRVICSSGDAAYLSKYHAYVARRRPPMAMRSRRNVRD